MDDQNKKQDNQTGLPAQASEMEKTAEEKLSECQKQAEEYLNNWKRERADFINYKKDENQRVLDFAKMYTEPLILDILSIYDDLDSMRTNLKDPSLAITIKNFEQILLNYDVQKIKVDDENFDPVFHEAVKTEEGGEKMVEIRSGWIMHGKVIRPARVRMVK